MSNLQSRQEKIQAKRKKTPWRDFVRDICSWRNLTFYKSDGMVTRYPISDRIPNLVTHKDFENLESLNLEFDSTHFFQKISFLLLKNPLPPTILFSWTENSVYSDQTLASKNAYLSNVVITSEDVLYSYAIRQHSSTIIESISINSSSQIFHSRNIFNSSQIFYSSNIYESSFCWFCSNCVSCHNCIRCDWLEHKSYCIDNIQLWWMIYEYIELWS